MSDRNTPWELGELILLSLDGTIQPDDFARLSERLRTDERAQRYYVEFMATYVAMGSHSAMPSVRFAPEQPESQLNPQLWGQLAEDESSAPMVRIKRKRKKRQRVEETSPSQTVPRPAARRRRSIAQRIPRWPVWTAISAAAAMLLLVGYVYLGDHFSGSNFARLIETSQAKWESLKDSEFFKGPVKLMEGYAKVSLGDGKEVTIQAPTEVEIVDKDTILLESGILRSSVADPTTSKLTVQTPGLLITDSGRDYSVVAHRDGRTQIHVFDGLLRFRSIHGSSHWLKAGQASDIDKLGNITGMDADPARFAAGIPSRKTSAAAGRRIDLSDIIGGGNGYGTGRTQVSIDLSNGTIVNGFHRARSGADGYVPAPRLAFIDGVFATKSLQMNGRGGVIYNSSRIINEAGNSVLLTLKGAPGAESAVYMHPNVGIRFDLEAVRFSNPGLQIASFTALCGMAIPKGSMPAKSMTGVYVVVDGARRFGASVSNMDDAIKIEVPISPRDRFLTLMVTEGSDGSLPEDHCLFIDPTLNMVSEQQALSQDETVR